MKKALITGITGQDGSYMAELLLDHGYSVHGLIRRSSTPSTWRIDQIIDKIELHYADLTDGTDIDRLIHNICPDEVYNLGAQSHVRVSFDTPVFTANTNALGPLRLLEAIRQYSPETKYYQASSSEMFGKVLETPQKLTTPFNPQSPYGASKVFAFYMTKAYRTGYNLFASNGILFNHESPRRGETFITQKVVQGFRKIRDGGLKKLEVGNVDAKRDWGYAKDYMWAIYKILHHKEPDDFLIATGETNTVRDMIQYVAELNGIKLTWEGEKDKVKAYDSGGRCLVEVDPKYYRPNEVELLQGDSSKAQKVLGWKPATTFHQLMELMVEEDRTYAERRGST